MMAFFLLKTNFHQPQLLQFFSTTEKPEASPGLLADDTLLTPMEERMEQVWQAYHVTAKKGQTRPKQSSSDFAAHIKKTETSFTENVRLNNHFYSRSMKYNNGPGHP